MKHESEIVEYRKINDGQFAVAVRCCGDEVHTNWLTVSADVLSDKQRFAEVLEAHCERVASHHQAALHADKHLAEMVGTKRTHG